MGEERMAPFWAHMTSAVDNISTEWMLMLLPKQQYLLNYVFKKSDVYFPDSEQSASLGRNKVFFYEFPELKWERECSLAGKNESVRWKQKTADTCCGGFQHSSWALLQRYIYLRLQQGMKAAEWEVQPAKSTRWIIDCAKNGGMLRGGGMMTTGTDW